MTSPNIVSLADIEAGKDVIGEIDLLCATALVQLLMLDQRTQDVSVEELGQIAEAMEVGSSRRFADTAACEAFLRGAYPIAFARIGGEDDGPDDPYQIEMEAARRME